MASSSRAVPESKPRLWTGRILTVFAVLFLVFDGTTKVMMVPAVLAAMAPLGYPDAIIRGIGILLLICTAIYLIPRTAVLGAILLTGYLGGAVASNVRISHPLFDTLFPVMFAVVIWAAIYLRDGRVRRLIPLRK